jgi:alanyl-tRNA synthetase
VAAGVRRIEAVTGLEAVKWAHEQRATLRAVLGALHTTAPQALDAVERLRTENRKLSTQVEKLLMQSVLTGASATAAPRHRTFDGVELRAQQQPDLTRDQLRSLADKLREGLSDGIVIAATEVDGKPSFVVAVTPSLTARYRAGDLVKKLAPVIGGGGGGRPDFAEAGGKQAGRLDALLNEAERAVEAAVAAGGTQQN